jgi:hypothetical protein
LQYYYFNPISRQYLFPVGFDKFPVFNFFYQPYTITGYLIWKTWKNIKLISKIFSFEYLKEDLPIQVQRIIPVNAIIALNRGTPGVEQKCTILGFDQDKKEAFFIKLGQSVLTIRNVNNEGNTLAQLQHLDFVPVLKVKISEQEYSLIQTNVFSGKRLHNHKMHSDILEMLFILAKQHVTTSNNFHSNVRSCFAHGDFCPWNIIVQDEKLKLFDWELSGIYPLGYDLFTYIFQTSFLLHPSRSINKILVESVDLINQYFGEFKIQEWFPYLLEFARLKIELEHLRKNQNLLNHFSRLLSYAEKIQSSSFSLFL